MCAQRQRGRPPGRPPGQQSKNRGLETITGRTCPSAMRHTIGDFTGQTVYPCPKAYVFGDRQEKAQLDPEAATPCCFDCDEFETCGNGDPKYAALPCINDVCALLKMVEYRRIVHCRSSYIYQLFKATGKLAGEAAKIAGSVNSAISEMIAVNKRRQDAAGRVDAPTQEVPPKETPEQIEKRLQKVETSAVPPSGLDEPNMVDNEGNPMKGGVGAWRAPAKGG